MSKGSGICGGGTQWTPFGEEASVVSVVSEIKPVVVLGWAPGGESHRKSSTSASPRPGGQPCCRWSRRRRQRRRHVKIVVGWDVWSKLTRAMHFLWIERFHNIAPTIAWCGGFSRVEAWSTEGEIGGEEVFAMQVVSLLEHWQQKLWHLRDWPEQYWPSQTRVEVDTIAFHILDYNRRNNSCITHWIDTKLGHRLRTALVNRRHELQYKRTYSLIYTTRYRHTNKHDPWSRVGAWLICWWLTFWCSAQHHYKNQCLHFAGKLCSLDAYISNSLTSRTGIKTVKILNSFSAKKY